MTTRRTVPELAGYGFIRTHRLNPDGVLTMMCDKCWESPTEKLAISSGEGFYTKHLTEDACIRSPAFSSFKNEREYCFDNIYLDHCPPAGSLTQINRLSPIASVCLQTMNAKTQRHKKETIILTPTSSKKNEIQLINLIKSDR